MDVINLGLGACKEERGAKVEKRDRRRPKEGDKKGVSISRTEIVLFGKRQPIYAILD